MAKRLLAWVPRPRLPNLGPFPVFVAFSLGMLVAGLVAGSGEPRQRTVRSQERGGASLDGTGTEAAGGQEAGPAAADAAGGQGAAATASGRRAGPGGATAATPTGPAGSGAGARATAGAAASTARGVTNEKIRIGVAIPDIGPFAVVDEFNLGDMRGHMEAMLDGWKQRGLVPVHGRDVEFVYRTFSIVGDEDIAACNGFVKDDKVFAVIGIRSFENGAECLADRFDTPIVTLNELSEEAYARMHPYLFTLRGSSERNARNFVHWAHERGLLAGRTIGLYEETDAAAAAPALQKALNAFGYKVAAHATTTSKQGGAQEQVAVQRFRSAGVDLALLLVAALPQASFMEQAQSQGYKPTYIDYDYGDHTSDAASSVYPASQYAGTLAMSLTRTGDIRAGLGLTPKREACVRNYERYSGRRIDRSSPESAELETMLQSCDEGEIFLMGLQQAGRDLNLASFIRGIETIRGHEGTSHGVYDFRADKHHGAEQQRTIQWQGECECWKTLTSYASLWTR